MDQRFQEQDPIASSASAFAAAAGQVSQSMSKPAGSLAGLSPISQLSMVLASTIMREGWEFEVGGEAIEAAKIADPECLLPLLMWDVERLHQTALSEPAGVQFLTDRDARFGVRPSVAQWDMKCASLVVMALEPLIAATERHEGRLDYLVEQFFADYSKGLIPWSPESQSTTIDVSRVPYAAALGSDAQAPIP